MQFIHVDTVFWKQESWEGQSLKIQSILFLCEHSNFHSEFTLSQDFKIWVPNGCGKCDYPLRVPSQDFWKGMPFWPQLHLEVVWVSHRATAGITKCTPTNASIEVPAHPPLGGAVTEETCRTPENPTTASEHTGNQGALLLLLTQ